MQWRGLGVGRVGGEGGGGGEEGQGEWGIQLGGEG